MTKLNQRASALCERMVAKQTELLIAVTRCESGATILNCGIDGAGGLAAGQLLTEVCLADLGKVQIVPNGQLVCAELSVCVTTDHPIAACMASQYAGWQISSGKFFAMGSGPMRAAAKKEKIFEYIGLTEEADVAVGVLETEKIPSAEVCEMIAADCGVAPQRLYLLVAPTASIAGTVQVVARSVETALHKMHEIGFPLNSVRSGHGSAPLPPVAADDLTGIGRTNDAVLYGGRVSLWVACDDSLIEKLGPQIPSSASRDFGRPFGEIFASYDHDFYKIDPHLFSPAVVTFNNLQSGQRFSFGEVRPDVLERSFGV